MSKEANIELFEEGLRENNPTKIATALLSGDVLLFKIQNNFLRLFYEGSTESLDVLQEFFPYVDTSDFTTAFESACKKNTEFNKAFLELAFKSSVKIKSFKIDSIIESAKNNYSEEFSIDVKNKILQEDMKYTIIKLYADRDLESIKILFSDSSNLKYLDDIFGDAFNKSDFEVCDLLSSFMHEKLAQGSFLTLLCSNVENVEAKLEYLVTNGFKLKQEDEDIDGSIKHYLFNDNSKTNLSKDSIERLKAMYIEENPEAFASDIEADPAADEDSSASIQSETDLGGNVAEFNNELEN
jgi:hypothetical protein